MVEGKRPSLGALAEFDRALSAWDAEGKSSLLIRWLDSEGFPDRIPVADWRTYLARLAEARRSQHPWPDELDARIEDWFRQTLRFSRPNGAPVFSATSEPTDAKVLFRYWSENLADPGLDTVVRWWFPTRERPSSPPPLPATARLEPPLAMLRAHWLPSGDFVAIDHSQPSSTTALELFANGRPWLGANWNLGREPAAPATNATMTTWLSNSSFDLAEWAFRAGETKVRRTALVLRGRRLALFADEVEGPATEAIAQFGLCEGVDVKPIAGSRALHLENAAARTSIRLLPLGLMDDGISGALGDWGRSAEGLELHQVREGKRSWLPLLASWDPQRHRKNVSWRPLTVTERGEICPPSTAVAYRVTWGRDETLVIYRSLARPTSRAFLGHQTQARFLVGLFGRDGEVSPILKVEE